jgi:hypothetical protein
LTASTQRTVPGDLAVVVPVGSDQIGQHLGIPAVGLGSGAAMPAPVVADDLGVDRIHLVASRHQRPDQQAPVGLDPHRHLRRILGLRGHQGMELPNPSQPIGDPVGGQHLAGFVEQAQVMVALAPVHPNKQHRDPPLL